MVLWGCVLVRSKGRIWYCGAGRKVVQLGNVVVRYWFWLDGIVGKLELGNVRVGIGGRIG